MLTRDTTYLDPPEADECDCSLCRTGIGDGYGHDDGPKPESVPSSERAIFFFGAGVESQQARIAELEAERDRLLEVVTDLARYAPDEREESSVAAPQFGLTAAEFEVFEAITAAWGKCVALKRCHPTEVAEAIPAIHYSQGAIMQRAAVRLYLTYFTHVEGFE